MMILKCFTVAAALACSNAMDGSCVPGMSCFEGRKAPEAIKNTSEQHEQPRVDVFQRCGSPRQVLLFLLACYNQRHA